MKAVLAKKSFLFFCSILFLSTALVFAEEGTDTVFDENQTEDFELPTDDGLAVPISKPDYEVYRQFLEGSGLELRMQREPTDLSNSTNTDEIMESIYLLPDYILAILAELRIKFYIVREGEHIASSIYNEATTGLYVDPGLNVFQAFGYNPPFNIARGIEHDRYIYIREQAWAYEVKEETLHQIGHAIDYYYFQHLPLFEKKSEEEKERNKLFNCNIFSTLKKTMHNLELPADLDEKIWNDWNKFSLSTEGCTNPDNDFAEHFMFYLKYPMTFCNAAKTTANLNLKYKFMKDKIFQGEEFTVVPCVLGEIKEEELEKLNCFIASSEETTGSVALYLILLLALFRFFGTIFIKKPLHFHTDKF